MGYLIENNEQQIIKAKVTLSIADLSTAGFIYNIPEYPAVANHFWAVSYSCAEIINGSTPYANQSVIHIQSENAANIQFRYDSNFMQGVTGSFRFAEIRTGILDAVQFVVNDQLQIHNPTALTGGDNEVNIYIGAILIKI
jgi:hypothetical protein